MSNRTPLAAKPPLAKRPRSRQAASAEAQAPAEPADYLHTLAAPSASPAATDALARSALRHVQRITARVRTSASRTAAAHELHVTDMYVLTVLLRSEPGCSATATELKAMLSYTSGGMTKRIDRLEQLALVERVAHPVDRRAWIVRLTAAGKSTAQKIVAQGRRQGVLMDLSGVLAEAEWQQLVKLLARVDAALDAAGHAAEDAR